MLQDLDSSDHSVPLNFVHVEGLADAPEEQHRQLASEVLPELLEPDEDRARIGGRIEVGAELRDEHRQPQREQEVENPPPVRLRQEAAQPRIRAIQRDPNRDRLAVAQGIPGQMLEPVRGPVSEVERA